MGTVQMRVLSRAERRMSSRRGGGRVHFVLYVGEQAGGTSWTAHPRSS